MIKRLLSAELLNVTIALGVTFGANAVGCPVEPCRSGESKLHQGTVTQIAHCQGPNCRSVEEHALAQAGASCQGPGCRSVAVEKPVMRAAVRLTAI